MVFPFFVLDFIYLAFRLNNQIEMFLKKRYKIKLYLILFTLCSCGSISDSFKSHIDGEYIPKNLNDAISELDKNISDSSKILIKKMSEEDFLSESHFGRGKAIRNNWNLWGKSRLRRYFKIKGISHPDDMSSIILKSYYRKINNQEIKLSEQVKYYKSYWKEVKKGTRLIKLPKEKKHPEKNLNVVSVIHYGQHLKEKKWAELYILKDSISNNNWIYDYYYGWKKIDDMTKKRIDDISIDQVDNIVDVLNEIFSK